MTAPAPAQDYRSTRWGAACVALHAEMLAAHPRLDLSVGPDEGAQTQAPPWIWFGHAGETPAAPLRGGGGDDARHPWDRPVLLSVELWGSSPEEAESIEEDLLLALDKVFHGRAGKPGKFEPMIGSATAGNLGAKIRGTITIRLAVVRSRRAAKATTSAITVGAASPAGTSEEVTLAE